MRLTSDQDGCVDHNGVKVRILDIDGSPVPGITIDFSLCDSVLKSPEQDQRIVYVDFKAVKKNNNETIVFNTDVKFKGVICRKCGENVCEICGVCPYCEDHE